MVLRLVKLLQARGVAVEPLLNEAHLSLAVLQTTGARIPYASADQLMEAAAAKLGANGLGVELGLIGSDESYGAAGLLLVMGASFRQGLSRSLAYQRLWGDGERFSLLAVGHDCAVRFRHPGPSRLAAAIVAECALVEVLEGLRALVDREAIPLGVDLEHRPLGDTAVLAEHFGVAPRFEQPENHILLPARLVDQPMHAMRDLLGAALERQAARALALLPTSNAMRERVQPLLAGEEGLARNLADVAAALRVSPRTLQRRLRQEHTSFEQLVDDARRAHALSLESVGTPTKEIAFRLGFQDPSALSRARRRWRK
jgi:AraC-like DNA-binding protein